MTALREQKEDGCEKSCWAFWLFVVLFVVLIAIIVIGVAGLGVTWVKAADARDAKVRDARSAAETPGNSICFFEDPDTGNDIVAILTDDSIRLLCESGRVCEVMGHAWKLTGGNKCGEFNILSEEHRKCLVCGRTEKRTYVPSMWTDWE